MAERSKAAASKAVIPCKWDRGFESPSLLQSVIFEVLNQQLADNRVSTYEKFEIPNF